MLSEIFKLVGGVLVVVALIALCYYMTISAKVVSYEWWYEDMVKQTVAEMVKEGALK